MSEHKNKDNEKLKSNDRIVFPTDRQLALRAKLKTGWSIKTGTLGQRTPPSQNSLTEKETEQILKVIKRAEVEEQKEAERVGKLVERLENIRHMALGKDPNECLLCGGHFGMLSGTGTKLICADCKKLVCQKCAVDLQIGKEKRETWLCKICAETREMWKKSGAWFFHGLPKYVLPPTSKYKNYKSIEKQSKLEKTNDGSSGSDEEHQNRLFNRSPKSPIKSPISPKIYEDTFSRQTSNSNESQKSYTHQYSPDVDFRTGRWSETSEGSSNYDLRVVSPHSLSGTSNLMKSDSFYSQTNLTNRYDSTTIMNKTNEADDKISLCSSVVGPSTFQGIPEEYMNQCPRNSIMGTIEVTLHYDSYSSVLHCTIHRAKQLTAMDINGLADPFCKLNILPTTNPSTRLRTKTVHKTRNPEFNETCTFYGITEHDIEKKSLHVLVLDDDRYGYDFMGEAKINLASLRKQNSLKVTSTLCCPINVIGDMNVDLQYLNTLWGDVPNTRGQILLTLTYNTKKRALIVGVQRCVQLPPMDSNGYSDPFVKLFLSPNTHNKKYKTVIKWKTLNPIFNEEFQFETRPNELSTNQCLKLQVWDKDYGKSNDYLGGLILGPQSKGKRLKHWLDMIKFPDHRHEGWHYLTEDMVTE